MADAVIASQIETAAWVVERMSRAPHSGGLSRRDRNLAEILRSSEANALCASLEVVRTTAAALHDRSRLTCSPPLVARLFPLGFLSEGQGSASTPFYATTIEIQATAWLTSMTNPDRWLVDPTPREPRTPRIAFAMDMLEVFPSLSARELEMLAEGGGLTENFGTQWKTVRRRATVNLEKAGRTQLGARLTASEVHWFHDQNEAQRVAAAAAALKVQRRIEADPRAAVRSTGSHELRRGIKKDRGVGRI